MKKLLLTYPNQRWLKTDVGTTWNLNPATLCLLAAMVRDNVECKIVDAQFYNMSIDRFKEEIAAFDPDFVGISVITSEYRDTLDMAAKAVKDSVAKAVVIAGGVHVTTMFEYVMRNAAIDFCVLGEGEYVLRDLIAYLLHEGPFPEEGVAYRSGGAVVAQRQAFVADLSKLPWPAYDLIDFPAYARSAPRSFNPQRPPELPYVRMVTTRGCPFGCSFCQVELISGKIVRTRDPDDVVAELLYLRERYGVRSVIFDDDNLLMGKNAYARALFSKMVEHKVDMLWIGIAFALFLLSDAMLDLMKASGCVGINVAIESGTERVLKTIVKKPIKNLADAPLIIDKIRQRGMYCIANFIIGFPGETWDEIRETIRFAERCGADYVKIFLAVPLYNTALYRLAKEKGVLTCDDAFPPVDWRYAQITSDEWTPKDIAILRAYEWDRINFGHERIGKVAEICGVTVDELKSVRKKSRDALVF